MFNICNNWQWLNFSLFLKPSVLDSQFMFWLIYSIFRVTASHMVKTSPSPRIPQISLSASPSPFPVVISPWSILWLSPWTTYPLLGFTCWRSYLFIEPHNFKYHVYVHYIGFTPELQNHTCNYILNIAFWVSNEHLKPNQMPAFPHASSWMSFYFSN